MARVFVSYSHTDSAMAARIREWLRSAGHDVFLDRDRADGIRPGDDWQERLLERLRWADAVVCLVTPASVNSIWCAGEITTALTRGSRLIPIQLTADLDHPLLRRIQHINLAEGEDVTRDRVRDELRQLDAAGGGGWADDKSPFPGLRPFDTDQHRVFFGRRTEVARLAALLRSPTDFQDRGVLVVVGPSGCGKSSLVRAGLLPAMLADPGWWVLTPIQPGANPLAVLAQELAAGLLAVGRSTSVPEVRAQLDDGRLVDLVDDLLVATPGPRRTRLLLVIDQFEELLTQCEPAERSRFAQLLGPAVRARLQVVATLRLEYLDQLVLDPDLAELVGSRRPFAVRPLLRDVLPEVIERPAELAGIQLDDGLAARLVADTASGETLPLLAYTLEQLAAGVSRGGRLRISDYDRLGGVHGTLTRQADAALAKAMEQSGFDRDQVVRELLRLVTVDEQGRPTRWRVRRPDLRPGVVKVLDPFVDRRLMISSSGRAGDQVEVAHEAFLTSWQPLATAIAENATALRAARRIEQAATDWDAGGRSTHRLWERGQLAAALADTGARLRFLPEGGARRKWRRRLVTDRVELDGTAGQFLHASIRLDRFRRRRSTVVLATLLALALVGAGIAVVQQGLAQQQQRLANARYLTAQATATLAADPRTALRLAEAAWQLNPSRETQLVLARLLDGTPYDATLAGHTRPVWSVAFAPDGRTLASAGADQKVILWDLTGIAGPRRMAAPLTGHSGTVRSVAFSPAGNTLATAGDDQTVILWDVTDPDRADRLGQPLTGHLGPVRSVAFSPDGRTLATAGDDRTVILWDVTDPARPRPLGQPLTGSSGTVRSVVFAPDGRTLAAAGDDRTVVLWDVTDPARPGPLGQPLVGHTGPVWSVAFSPDGRTLASAGGDQKVILWDLTDPARPQQAGSTPGNQANTVRSLAFAPDGRTLATARDDHTVTMWDLSDRSRPQPVGLPLTGHTGGLWAVAFGPDGTTLATAGDDRAVILWDLADRTHPRPIGAPLAGRPGAVNAAEFSPDGRTLVVPGPDGAAVLWDVTNRTRPGPLGPPLAGHTAAVCAAVFAADGQTLATASYDGTVILWDLADRARPRQLGPPLPGRTGDRCSVSFAPDGGTLATAGNDGNAVLWDLTDRNQAQRLAVLADGGVWSVAFAPDGRRLATAGDNGAVAVWDLADRGDPRLTGPPSGKAARSVSFAPDGTTLATAGNDSNTVLWDLADPAHPQRLAQLTGHTSAVNAAVFAPDGHTMATASNDHTVILWDLADPGHPRRFDPPLAGHTGTVWSVAFAPDGHTLATAGNDGAVILWDLPSAFFDRDHVLQIACARTGGALDRAGWSRLVDGLPYADACPG